MTAVWKVKFGNKFTRFSHFLTTWMDDPVANFLINRVGIRRGKGNLFAVLILKQPRRRRRQQKRHKFAYLIMKNNSFARLTSAFFDVKWLVLQLCGRSEHMMTKLSFDGLLISEALNSRIVRTYFAIIMTLNNWDTIKETRSYIFRWLSRCRRRRVCLNFLISYLGLFGQRMSAPRDSRILLFFFFICSLHNSMPMVLATPRIRCDFSKRIETR